MMIEFLKKFFSLKKTKTKNISLKVAVYIILPLLGLCGCLAIFNATFYNDNPFFFAGKQLIWLSAGTVMAYLLSRINFNFYVRYSYIIAAFSFLSLIAVLFIGNQVNGMRGWFSLGPVFIQPSEIAKVPFMLILCSIATGTKNVDKRFIYMLLFSILWIFPVVIQPDFGTALIFIAAFGAVYWISGGKLWHLSALLALSVAPVFYLIYSRPYILKRFQGFIDPKLNFTSGGWHISQFRYTMARGGFWGADLGKAVWANSYLPLSHSDSAFAALTESIGFIGVLPVLMLPFILTFIAYRISSGINKSYPKFFIIGAVLMFAFQAILHISVNITIVPPTGIPMPILSYGGSSLIAAMSAFGIVLSAADKNSLQSFPD